MPSFNKHIGMWACNVCGNHYPNITGAATCEHHHGTVPLSIQVTIAHSKTNTESSPKVKQ